MMRCESMVLTSNITYPEIRCTGIKQMKIDMIYWPFLIYVTGVYEATIVASYIVFQHNPCQKQAFLVSPTTVMIMVNTDCGMGGRGSNPGGVWEFFSSTPLPDQPWGLPSLQFNEYLGALSLGVKRPGREADHSSRSSAEVKECVGLYFHSPIRLHVVVLS
jgi:hypothetical protein